MAPQLKTSVIESLSAIVGVHAPPVVAPHVDVLCGLLVPACAESYYKLAAEALRAVAVLVRTVRPPQVSPANLLVMHFGGPLKLRDAAKDRSCAPR